MMTKREFNGKIYFAITQAYFYFLLMKTGQTDHYWAEEKLKKDIFENFEEVVSCKLYGDTIERRKKWYKEATTWDNELELMKTYERANRRFARSLVQLKELDKNTWPELCNTWCKFVADTKECIFYKDVNKLKNVIYNI